ncbi:MAG: MxaS protein [Burkholderiaceae bacterium]
MDRPDPRRLDLRASLRNPLGDWLVRVPRQRSEITVHVIVDVSPSMHFGQEQPKLLVVAHFVEALGQAASRAGDALAMMAFGANAEADLFIPASRSKGIGQEMARRLRTYQSRSRSRGPRAVPRSLLETLDGLAHRDGLVFLVSDFHWNLEALEVALDRLPRATVVPLIVWDPAEIEAPVHDGVALLWDAESGASRTLWIRPKLREQWLQAVARRRIELETIFRARAIRPFYVCGRFDPDALTRYFVEYT